MSTTFGVIGTAYARVGFRGSVCFLHCGLVLRRILSAQSLKSGWEVEKMTSSGKFLARKLSLDATKTMISWPSNSKRRSIEGTIGTTTPTHVIRVQEITSVLGGLPAGTLGTAGRCVTIQTKAAPFSFRFDSPEDASVFISCVKELMPGN